jgi:7-cyano-7-deazaguanine synthase in queuosine biosynthesis
MGSKPHIFLCNKAELPKKYLDLKEDIFQLEYQIGSPVKRNVKLKLPIFVQHVFHLPHRILDLLEIAAYVFAADRLFSRGIRSALEYHSWARSFHFVIRVRDFEFWHNEDVKRNLSEALRFMSGDLAYDFTFQSGHETPPTSLFDKEEFKITPTEETNILLFSGGLDSLVGALEFLEKTDNEICLISHRSGQPGTHKTQNRLYKALNARYEGRIKHYKFYCSLTDTRATEETQRTRGFLYTSIAYALSKALSQDRFYVHENGLTSVNFSRRQDLINARASRTTHPQTLYLIQRLFSNIEESPIEIINPYLWLTKTDVLQKLKQFNGKDLLSSSVSCSQTLQNVAQATHCGGCFQCIDRRFAAYATELNEMDHSGLYALNFVLDEIESGEVRTTLIDYVRQARNFSIWNTDHFYKERLNELTDLVDYVDGQHEDDEIKIERVWQLCRRHGNQVLSAIKRMQIIHDDPYTKISQNSFLDLVNQREYLKEPVRLLIEKIYNRLNTAIPILFQKNSPRDEPDLNDKIEGILSGDKVEFEREHPAISFATTKAIPDHSYKEHDLLIEAKYIRKNTPPSKVTEGIAADLTKYPEECHKLFIVYDPNREIHDDVRFKEDFERKGNCTISIIR